MIDDLSSSELVLTGLLDVQADRDPEADAITDGRVRLTWKEYRDRAAGLAGALADSGVGIGDRVGVHMPKSVDSFVSVHAILRVGAVVVPVDWFAPPAHVRSVVADADIAAIVSSADEKALGELVDVAHGPAVLRPDETGPHADPAVVTSSDDAYIVYTSGSTGRPKGIVHTHASALAYARTAVATYGLCSRDRLANVAPLHFDQSTFELYAAPLAGAAVVVLSDVVLRFPASVSDLIARERVTVWYSVPYAITQLTERGAVHDRDLSSLRWVLFGGESFQPGALRAAMGELPGTRFSNVYGPAEVNQCTFHHLDEPPTDDAPVPIGLPWSGAHVLIVDEDERVVDGTTPGQLLVAADTMMDRYWGRPDLTAASIVDRIEDGVGRSWYRTGDTVIRRGDGQLVFLGRIDHQVKLRGHRIELEAVEAVVCEDPRVADCAVVLEHTDGDDQLVVAMTPAPDTEAADALLQHLRTRLPRYAVPSEVVGIVAIPRTDTGKIDRPGVVEAIEARREADRLRLTSSGDLL